MLTIVNMNLLHPQEIEVHYIIPSLRNALAKKMKKLGMTNTKIAEIFGMNKSAITQYLNNKRGNNVEFDSKVISEIDKSSKLIDDKISFVREIQRLLKFIRTHSICKIHKSLEPCMKNCSPEEIGCMEEK